jgi:hypothetical protein
MSQFHFVHPKPTSTGLGLKKGLCSEILATNHQSHGMALSSLLTQGSIKQSSKAFGFCDSLYLPPIFFLCMKFCFQIESFLFSSELCCKV